MRRALVLVLALTPIAACATVGQNAYDAQAKAECYEIPNVEAQRACLNEIESRN